MTLSTTMLRPLLLLILVGTLTYVLVQLGLLVVPSWQGNYLIMMYMLASLEGLYSPSLIKAQNVHGGDVTKFHFLELLVLILLTKVISSLGSGMFDRLLSIDISTVIGMLLVVVAWACGVETGHDFAELDDPVPIVIVDSQYVSPALKLRQRFFVGGFVLLGVVGILNWQTVPLNGLIVPVLVYFVTLLLFLSQVRFAAARREWRSLGLNAPEDTAAPWFRSSLGLIGLAAIAAFVLPTQYTRGLLEFVRTIVEIIVGVLLLIVSVFFWLVTLPLRLLMGQPIGQPADIGPIMPPPTMPQQTASGSDAIWSLLIKLLLVAVVGYVIVSYLRDNPEFFAMLQKFRAIQWLRQWWEFLRRQARGAASALRIQLPRSLPAWMRRNRLEPFKYVRLNALSPRERIFYFYLSTLRRAHEQGLPRKPDQTPYEYEDVLKRELTDAETELGALTQAFVEARYSPQPIDTQQVHRMQVYWQQLRHVIQRLKRQKRADLTKQKSCVVEKATDNSGPC